MYLTYNLGLCIWYKYRICSSLWISNFVSFYQMDMSVMQTKIGLGATLISVRTSRLDRDYNTLSHKTKLKWQQFCCRVSLMSVRLEEETWCSGILADHHSVGHCAALFLCLHSISVFWILLMLFTNQSRVTLADYYTYI